MTALFEYSGSLACIQASYFQRYFQLVFNSHFLSRFSPLIQRKQATKSFQLESPFFEGRGGPIALVIFPWGSGPPVPLWISPCPFVLLTPKVSHLETLWIQISWLLKKFFTMIFSTCFNLNAAG